jgi:[protein-PII] uridylyltransferase
MQNEVGRLRRKFREARAQLFPENARSATCLDLLQRYSSLVDGIVDEIYEISCSSAEKEVSRCTHSALAIVATGGYGRRELNPFSDIDIAFIPSEEADPWVEATVHMAFRLVMDVFLSFREIHVGYSYRPVAELSTWDTATLTAMLDARHLAGDRSLSLALQNQLRATLSPLDLVLEITGFPERSKSSLGEGLYSVEPDLKTGSGALRDLHRARWIYKLLLNESDEQLWDALHSGGYLSSADILKVKAAAEWFWRARNWLHLVTGKRSDVLINNYQDRIARPRERMPAARNGCQRCQGTFGDKTVSPLAAIWCACFPRTDGCLRQRQK